MKELGPGIDGINFRSLPTKPCDLNDVDGNNKGSPFFKTDPLSVDILELNRSKLKCFDDPDFKLIGSFQSTSISNLLVAFEKCDRDKRNDCKTEEEINAWLQYKYIIVLENTKRFIPYKFGEERIDAVSILRWFPINSELRLEKANLIKRTRGKFNDY